MSYAPTASVLAGVMDAVQGQLLVQLALDNWSPNVQGAVGHVLGLRDVHGGGEYVLKIFPTDRHAQLDTEVAALEMVAGVPAIPAPGLVAHGYRSDSDAAGYLLTERRAGSRWADRRRELNVAETAAITEASGKLLRHLHELSHESHFGSLIVTRSTFLSSWDMVNARLDELLARLLTQGGSTALATDARQFVNDREDAINSCEYATLCHGDLNDGNLLVTAAGTAAISAVVDFERACWDDPMRDMALTRLHVLFHTPNLISALDDGYGGTTDNESVRLAVFELLQLIHERNWLITDQPAKWQASARVIDADIGDRLT